MRSHEERGGTDPASLAPRREGAGYFFRWRCPCPTNCRAPRSSRASWRLRRQGSSWSSRSSWWSCRRSSWWWSSSSRMCPPCHRGATWAGTALGLTVIDTDGCFFEWVLWQSASCRIAPAPRRRSSSRSRLPRARLRLPALPLRLQRRRWSGCAGCGSFRVRSCDPQGSLYRRLTPCRCRRGRETCGLLLPRPRDLRRRGS